MMQNSYFLKILFFSVAGILLFGQFASIDTAFGTTTNSLYGSSTDTNYYSTTTKSSESNYVSYYSTTTPTYTGSFSTATATTTFTYSTTTETKTAKQVVVIVPQNPIIYTGEKIYFKAFVDGTEYRILNWTVNEGSIGGIINNEGLYYAPNTAGIFHIMAWDRVSYYWGTTTVTVRPKEDDRVYIQTATTTYISPTAPTTTVPVTTITEPLIKTYVATTSTEEVSETFKAIESAVGPTAEESREETVSLLYKDSNKDGISDYESKYVYNIDPVKPSVTSVYEGRKINAGEKILLGFDPQKSTLTKVSPEEPTASRAPVAPSYKINEVKLTEEKKVAISGKALPNGFVTIYIYSTPIIVTVKADSNGEWQYTLDKELEDGQHQIYTATVNNTGKILAKSREFTFTKTAEAAALVTSPKVNIPVSAEEPGFLSNFNIYSIVFVIVTLLVTALVFIGTNAQSKSEQ